jgi:hypothetical protein
MCELWKDIKGSINYQISNRGRIRSKDKTTIRKNGKKITTKGRLLKTSTDTKGYIRVQIPNRTIKIHRAVAEAFIENPLNLPEVNHIDGNKSNNDVSNLEWCTHKNNIKHAIETGLYNKREKIKRDNKGRFIRKLGE